MTGFVNDTVPMAIHLWARQPHDLDRALDETVRLGGDTDTVAAIVGGLVGAGTGAAGVPVRWSRGLLEWPRSVNWMRRLSRALASGSGSPRLFWPAIMFRNALFTLGVYLLIMRRTLPPY